MLFLEFTAGELLLRSCRSGRLTAMRSSGNRAEGRRSYSKNLLQ